MTQARVSPIDAFIAVVVVCLAWGLRQIPPPGIIPMYIDDPSMDWATHLGGMSLLGLVGARAIASSVASTPNGVLYGRIVAAVYIVGCGIASMYLALALSGLSDPSGYPTFQLSPYFFVFNGITFMAVGALMWWGAERLDQVRLDGAITLLAVQIALNSWQWHWEQIALFGQGASSLVTLLESGLLPTVAASILILLFRPKWPIAISGGFELRTPVALLILPTFASAAVPMPVLLHIAGLVGVAVIAWIHRGGRFAW